MVSRQGFPERELPRFRKEASILRTETFGSHTTKARANDPPHENVWIAQRKYHILPKGSVNHGQAALVNARLTGETCAKHIADICYTASGPRAVTQPNPKKCSIKPKMKEWVIECATHIFPSKN